MAGAAFAIPTTRATILGLFDPTEPEPASGVLTEPTLDLVVNNAPNLGPGLTSPALPNRLPPCPATMRPVSWTVYADGYILVCGANQQGFTVLAADPTGHKLIAEVLTYTDRGLEIEFADGTWVSTSLGGGLVEYNPAIGAISTYIATQGWTLGGAEVRFTTTANLPTCPTGTWPISLSTWQGGWLFVCGTAATAPTNLYYADADVGQGTATRVTITSGGYCATTRDGRTACTYYAPAVVTFAADGTTPTQRSVASNYFADTGVGGAGQGTGAYGVPAPDDTAAAQVRYLTDILAKSKEARAPLNDLYLAVDGCHQDQSTIDGLTSIRDNRVELLTALASTPVDKIANGNRLVSLLTTALTHSRDDDQAILDWASAALSGSCASAHATYFPRHQVASDAAGVAKQAFADEWNATIPATYGGSPVEPMNI
jgi:hypothetical protein